MPKLIIRGTTTSWLREAGRRFREGLLRIAQKMAVTAVRVHLEPESLTELVSRKIHGMANTEFAQAIKNFNEAQRSGIAAELELRVLESKVKEAEAESRLAEINTVKAEAELIVKLKELGLDLGVDAIGIMTVLPHRKEAAVQDLGTLVFKQLREQIKTHLEAESSKPIDPQKGR